MRKRAIDLGSLLEFVRQHAQSGQQVPGGSPSGPTDLHRLSQLAGPAAYAARGGSAQGAGQSIYDLLHQKPAGPAKPDIFDFNTSRPAAPQPDIFDFNTSRPAAPRQGIFDFNTTQAATPAGAAAPAQAATGHGETTMLARLSEALRGRFRAPALIAAGAGVGGATGLAARAHQKRLINDAASQLSSTVSGLPKFAAPKGLLPMLLGSGGLAALGSHIGGGVGLGLGALGAAGAMHATHKALAPDDYGALSSLMHKAKKMERKAPGDVGKFMSTAHLVGGSGALSPQTRNALALKLLVGGISGPAPV